MTESDVLVHTVSFSSEGLWVQYTRVPQDIRKNGLAWQHSVMVPLGSDYDDEIETFTDALKALILDVLDDEATAEQVELTEEKEDEDDDDDD